LEPQLKSRSHRGKETPSVPRVTDTAAGRQASRGTRRTTGYKAAVPGAVSAAWNRSSRTVVTVEHTTGPSQHSREPQPCHREGHRRSRSPATVEAARVAAEAAALPPWKPRGPPQKPRTASQKAAAIRPPVTPATSVLSASRQPAKSRTVVQATLAAVADSLRFMPPSSVSV
jgi:hypothetical protein